MLTGMMSFLCTKASNVDRYDEFLVSKASDVDRYDEFLVY